MTDCQRCGSETDRRTLADDPLCADCAEWREEHTESRDVDQRGLDEWGDETDE